MMSAMSGTDPSGPYLEAIQRGFNFARELGSGCRPVHFLVGISEGHGPAAQALSPAQGGSLRAIVTARGGAVNSASYLHMQAQGAATSLAESRGQQPSPEHLLVALVDQGEPEVKAMLNLAGLDRAEVRRRALTAIGGTGDEPPLAFPALDPAGTLDRPPLPVADLEHRAWTVLRWRQDHLPLHRVRGPSGAQALRRLEQDAAWRLADRLQLEEDQRYSLIHQHVAEVELRTGVIAPARPRTVTRPRHPALRGVTVGWRVWLGNRRTSVRDRWFRLRTLGDYRQCPEP